MKTVFIILLGLSLCFESFAQGSGSHGGEAARCVVDGKTTYETLDYFEAVYEHQRNLDVQGSDWKSKVISLINRVNARDAGMGELLLQTYREFLESYLLVERVNLPVVNDSRIFIQLNPNCVKIQAAVQKETIRTLEKRYYFDRMIWESMDDTQKAGLVMHELLFRVKVIAFRLTDATSVIGSEGVRYFNGVLGSDQFEKITRLQYVSLAKDSYFFEQVMMWQGGVPLKFSIRAPNVNLSNVDFYPDENTVKSAYMDELNGDFSSKIDWSVVGRFGSGDTHLSVVMFHFSPSGKMLYASIPYPSILRLSDGEIVDYRDGDRIILNSDFTFSRIEHRKIQ